MSSQRVLRLLSASLVLLATACANSPPKPFLERLQWGSAPEALGPHVEVVREEWMAKRVGRCYRRLDDGTAIGDVPSRDTEYCFNRGALYLVRTYFDDEPLKERWQQWLTGVYGQPQTSSPTQANWDAKGTGISLQYAAASYHRPEDVGTVTWTHRANMPPPDGLACEPWDPEFSTCIAREHVRIKDIDAR